MENEKIIHIFDLDDTLVLTPKIANVLQITDGFLRSGDYVINKFLLEINHILFSLDNSFFFIKENEEIVLRNKKNDIQLIILKENVLNLNDTEQKLFKGLFKEKDGKIVLRYFKNFFKTEGTVGTVFNKSVLAQYNTVSNKMILTGRSISLKKGISYILFNYLCLDKPNKGFFLFNGRKSIPEFKLGVLVDSIKKNKWAEVHFWEDNEDWLNFIADEIKILYPELSFIKHLVK